MATIQYRVTLAADLELAQVNLTGAKTASSYNADGSFADLPAGDYTLTAVATATARTDVRTVNSLDEGESRFIGMHIA